MTGNHKARVVPKPKAAEPKEQLPLMFQRLLDWNPCTDIKIAKNNPLSSALFKIRLCSECKAFSAINRFNRDRMDPGEWDRLVSDGIRDLILCMEIAAFQVERGRFFAFEHPLYATSWRSMVVAYVASLPGVVFRARWRVEE